MSTYQTLKGLKVKFLAADTSGDRIKKGEIFYNSVAEGKIKVFVGVPTWASGGNLDTARNQIVAVGSQTASIAFAGFDGTNRSALAEEYNGSAWTEVGDLNTARGALAGAGTQDTAIGFGGSTNPSTVVAVTESWDGSSWTEVGDLNTARFNLQGFGISTAAIAVGGSAPSVTESWDGSSWTAVNNLNSTRANLGSAGIQTAGLAFGGNPSTTASESWDGTSWTATNALPAAKGSLAGSGTQTSALAFGANIPGPLAIGGYAALGQLTFFAVVGIIIFGLSEIFPLSGYLHKIAIAIAVLLIILGALMLLGWTSHLLSKVQDIIDKYQTNEDSDEVFTPRRNMYLWGIGYSAASVDCTAAAVFPFIGWLAVVGRTEFIFGLVGLMISVSFLMIAVTALVSFGRQAMIGYLRSSTGLIKAIGSWMMMFAGIGLFIYLTEPEMVSTIVF